jgi:hypothetical protein
MTQARFSTLVDARSRRCIAAPPTAQLRGAVSGHRRSPASCDQALRDAPSASTSRGAERRPWAGTHATRATARALQNAGTGNGLSRPQGRRRSLGRAHLGYAQHDRKYRHGHITKAGHRAVRHVLGEAAQARPNTPLSTTVSPRGRPSPRCPIRHSGTRRAGRHPLRPCARRLDSRRSAAMVTQPAESGLSDASDRVVQLSDHARSAALLHR